MFGKAYHQPHYKTKFCTSGLQDPTPTGYENNLRSCWAILISLWMLFIQFTFRVYHLRLYQIPNFTFLEPGFFLPGAQFH